jgi:hypothetical protein
MSIEPLECHMREECKKICKRMQWLRRDGDKEEQGRTRRNKEEQGGTRRNKEGPIKKKTKKF